MYDTRDTIAAIATAPGGAVRAIVRISGAQTREILDRVVSSAAAAALANISRPSVVAASIRASGSRVELPVDIYWWPGPRSYTRESLAELHTIGSTPLVAALLETVCQAGARLARPGEFTLRAFLAGRLDLAQAEAVIGVVDAQGDAELERALEQLAGGLARPLAALRDRLLNLLADLEAGLDFVEEDIEFVAAEQVARTLQEATAQLDRIEAQWSSRGRHDELAKVLLLGLPNVGKSSLFNALAPASQALVSDQPGTTRDYLTATLDMGGIQCQLIDTAGAASPCEAISQAAEQHRLDQAEHCDLRLLCVDASRPLAEWERQQICTPHHPRQLVVLTKCDLPPRATLPCPTLRSSVRQAGGLDELRKAIAEVVVDIRRSTDESSPAAQHCLESVRHARRAIERAAELNVAAAGDELVAGELRVALEALGQVAGAVYTDDLLDRVFSRFCIGK